MNRKEAIEAGRKWYMPDTPCPKCHTLAERYVANGRCRGCNPKYDDAGRWVKQPDRKKAIDAGEKWYTPITPCSKCHTTALRHVGTGRCQGCKPLTHQHEPKRWQATDKVYIPDHDCLKCGTKSPRWVSNNKCIGCSDPSKAASMLLMMNYPGMVIQRREAEWAGLIYYHNDLNFKCTHGHNDWRDIKTGKCLKCVPPNWMIPTTK